MLKHLRVFGPLSDSAKIINVLLSWYTHKHWWQYLRDSDCFDCFHLWNPKSFCAGSLACVTCNPFIWNFVRLPWHKSRGVFPLNWGTSVPDSRWRTLVWFCVVSLQRGGEWAKRSGESSRDYFKKYSAREEEDHGILVVLYPGVIIVVSYHVPEIAPSKIRRCPTQWWYVLLLNAA